MLKELEREELVYERTHAEITRQAKKDLISLRKETLGEEQQPRREYLSLDRAIDNSAFILGRISSLVRDWFVTERIPLQLSKDSKFFTVSFIDYGRADYSPKVGLKLGKRHDSRYYIEEITPDNCAEILVHYWNEDLPGVRSNIRNFGKLSKLQIIDKFIGRIG